MRNDIPTISPTTDSALISIISHLISPPCGSHALAMPDTQIEYEENEVVFFLLSFSGLSHHRMCGSAFYAQYYAKGSLLCIMQKTCYVEGYVMINVSSPEKSLPILNNK